MCKIASLKKLMTIYIILFYSLMIKITRIQGSKRHRIPDPDPQHCSKVKLSLLYSGSVFIERT